MSVFLQEGRHPGEFILTEMEGHLSRENALIAASTAVNVGDPLIRNGAAGAPVVGNATFAGTGNGTFTKASTAYSPNVQAGNYSVQLIDEGTNAGDFLVIRPNGTIDGIASVGVAYDGEIKFTIADGSTDFTSPAVFTVPVSRSAAGAAQYIPLAYNVTPGVDDDLAIALYPKLSTDSDRGIAVLARLAEVNGNCINWPANQSADNLLATKVAYARQRIIIR